MQLQFDFEDRPDALLTCDEIYGKADEELLRRLGEDRRLEKKSIGVHGKALGEYFSMWANTSPEGGVIVVGIRNDATIEGCSRAGQDRVNQIEKAGATYCPDAQVAVKQVQVHRDHDGKLDFVLVFRVKYHSSKVVRTVDGRAFIRRGDSKMELGSPDEIRQ
ncbi:MAG: ATP-binding protein, partial [Candidatus Omnitrophica bacterium]|nr:ATP-binding protein [Candidatus Omnitrophota bacterium]